MPGIGAMSSPWASSHASAICAGVASSSEATAGPRRRCARFCSKLPSVKRGLVLRQSSSRELLGGADRPGEEAVPERRVGHEADAQLAQQRKQLGLRIAGPQRVLGLQRGDRVHGVGAADRLGAGLRQADVQHLALGHQLGERADGLLDRRVRVDAVLVVEVDAVGPEPLQRALRPRSRMFAGLLSSTPGPPPACETSPNFVATTTSSRRPFRARPTSSSLTKGRRSRRCRCG